MVYTSHLWWLGGWFIISLQTLNSNWVSVDVWTGSENVGNSFWKGTSVMTHQLLLDIQKQQILIYYWYIKLEHLHEDNWKNWLEFIHTWIQYHQHAILYQFLSERTNCWVRTLRLVPRCVAYMVLSKKTGGCSENNIFKRDNDDKPLDLEVSY